MMRLALSLCVALAVPASAQQDRDRTLADIRQQLSVLQVELQGLTRELSTTGAPALGIEGTSFPDRVMALETQVRELAAQAERLTFRVESVARDGGDRLETLRFRLCELTPDCALSALPPPAPLGGDTASAAVPAQPVVPAAPAGPELAVDERSQLDAVKVAVDDDRHADAVVAADRFLAAFPNGPLTPQVQLLRGEALAAQDQHALAARAFLDAFSGAPDGAYAAQALLNLSRSLGALGQTSEACLTLDEIPIRFPDTDAAEQSEVARRALGCT